MSRSGHSTISDNICVLFDIDRRDGLRTGVPRKLFDATPYDAEPGGHQHYDVSGDGRRFVMIKHVEEVPSEMRVAVGVLPETTAP